MTRGLPSEAAPAEGRLATGRRGSADRGVEVSAEDRSKSTERSRRPPRCAQSRAPTYLCGRNSPPVRQILVREASQQRHVSNAATETSEDLFLTMSHWTITAAQVEALTWQYAGTGERGRARISAVRHRFAPQTAPQVQHFLDRIHLPLVKRHPVRSHLSKLAFKCKNADITPRSRGHYANAARTSATRWAAQSSARALATQRDQPGGQSRTRNRRSARPITRAT